MRRVLLVDDDHDIRELGCALLRHAGYETHVAESAAKALQLLYASTYDILITDANMPEQNGFELLKILRADSAFIHLTTVMLTGRRERRDVEQAVDVGVDAYIVKPLDPLLFIEKINELSHKKSNTDEWTTDPSSVNVLESGGLSLPMEITSISALGVVVIVSHPLRPGAMVDVDSNLFARIGMKWQKTRVFACRASGDRFEARLVFTNLTAVAERALKKWLASGGRLNTLPMKSRAV